MTSNEDKIYINIVAFDEIYNFVVQTLFHLKSSLLTPEKTIYYLDLDTENWDLGSISFFCHKMTSNEKSLKL
jgi:hypothetical protein